MTLLHALLLGILQGLTEFLPISSSGHLALVEEFLRVPMSARDLQGFDIVLHGGSLIALFVCYAGFWWKMGLSIVRRDPASRRLLLLLILASIPAALTGFFLEDFIAEEFRSLVSLAVQLLLSGLILLLAERFKPRGHMGTLRPIQSLMIGIAQAFALVPGLSRSGLTIAAGRAVGLSRKDAIDFSFLMALPVIFGAVLLIAVDVVKGTIILPPPDVTTVGFVASLIASFASIWTLRRYAYQISMNWFSAYLILFSLAILAWAFHLQSISDPALVRHWVRDYGWIAIFLFALVETAPPISFFSPGVLALILGGALIADPLTAVLFFMAALTGLLLGNMIFYLLGRRFGREFAHTIHLTEARLQAVDRYMRRFGAVSVMVGQCIGTVRPVIAFVAGTAGVQRRTFFPFALAGSAFLSLALLSLGFFLRDRLEWVLPIVGVTGTVLIAVAAIVVWILERRLRKKRED